jgi:O-antigen/teichoic acid export membrane protein
MSDKGASYRQILRSSSIIGGASVINIVLGIARMKAAAVFLGPAGVGLIGLFTNLTGLATAIAGMGVSNVGVRQIAEAVGKNDQVAIAQARRALFWATLFLAMLGAGLFWLLRGVLADKILHDSSLSSDVGWLALAVGLAIASASQYALLNGLRRIGDLSRVSVYSGALSSVLGIMVLAVWGRAGLLAFILIAPIASFALGHWYVSRLPEIAMEKIPFDQLSAQWQTLVKLGFAFMLSSLVLLLGQLLVRSLIQKELGLDALGHFQAAWVISMTYIGFVLAAMGADYYPRLTAAISDHASVNRMVNEQTEVALLLAGPIFIAMMALLPWVIQLLYSPEFLPATQILNWQILGDILKICSWPLGFILLAAGDGKKFVIVETIGVSAFVLLTWITLPWLGLQAAGVSFAGMYFVYLPLVFWLAKRRTGFSWDKVVFKHAVILIVVAIAVMGLSRYSQILAAFCGLILSTVLLFYGFSRLAHKADLSGVLGKMAELIKNVMKRIGVWHE